MQAIRLENELTRAGGSPTLRLGTIVRKMQGRDAEEERMRWMESMVLFPVPAFYTICATTVIISLAPALALYCVPCSSTRLGEGKEGK